MASIDDIWGDLLDDTEFSLFAIHSSMEDHALAYNLNRSFGLRLRRTPKDHELEREGSFVVFNWKDRRNFREWTLFRNPGWETIASVSGGLFADERSRNRRFLVPEKKEVDYFLKLEGEEHGMRILPGLLSTPKVTTAYRLQPAHLKSRHNLLMY